MGAFFARFLLLRKNKKKRDTEEEKMTKISDLSFYLGHFSSKERNFCLFLFDGFLFSWHPNGGEVSSEPRRAMSVNSFAGDRKNSKLWRGGGLDLGR